MIESAVTAEKKQALTAVFSWLKNGRTPYLTVGGYAGTGKTTLIGIMRRMLHAADPKARVALCAYTGKASRVLESTLRTSGALFNQDSIGTIHGLIYSPIVSSGKVVGWQKKESLACNLIVVDEASMVDGDIWHDLTSFEVPILAVGDHGQLPPINGRFNLMAKPDITLTHIHRQAQDNPIIKLSILARQEGRIPLGNYGQGVQKLNRYDSQSGQDIENWLQNRYEDNQMILTGFNWTRVKLNQAIREYRDFDGDQPRVGERVICLKNNWEKGIYNGMLGTISRLIPGENNNHDYFEAEIVMDDELVYNGTILARQFGQLKTAADQQHIKKENVDLFDFGYTLTVHKAQGSQAQKVLLFEERSHHMDDDTWRRWLYTGVTRAQEELTIVGHP